MKFDEAQKLTDLNGLGLRGHLLQVDQLGNGGMRETVMTARGADEAKAEGADEQVDLIEARVVR